MKRLVMLLLLVPAAAGAQPWCPSNVSVVSESWSYYCDGAAKHLRLTLIVETVYDYDDFSTATDLVCEIGVFGTDGNSTLLNAVSAAKLAGNLHQLVAENIYPDPMASVMLRRYGWIHWRCSDYIDPDIWFYESDGIFSATDATCAPLSVGLTTWGAVKALYR